MPRNGDAVRRRLQDAALDLYTKNGFDQTTTAQIAAQAGVTERTFFRHFADKREVFFDGEVELIEKLMEAVRSTPDGAAPLDMLIRAFTAVAPLVEANRPILAPRQRVIEAVPALQERALAKSAAVTAALAQALVERGTEPALAMLAARTGIAAFGFAAATWHGDVSSSLASHVEGAFAQLCGLTQLGGGGADQRSGN
ncbi:TetR/AcrR family transcriptional regulator [Paraburkholderia sp. D15]|uniref:TetR family transcriptional regulator n=1 Tax=Paraburkholderia sp. D15 TaxID=2880218 RepID=UPI0024792C3F|nr:TetR family transcriptional regulator [Paraburkholderia sp. D15]WGS54055.1 TetR/AcrR family transcriptional regulator [Paraburkholderia sp. D15]